MTYTDEIMSVFERATLPDTATGMGWYPYAHSIACEASDPAIGAGVIAALSPRMPWHRNVLLARVAFNDVRLFRGALGNSISKVNAILDGTPISDVLKASKTRSFFDNILNPLTSTAVTIDVWAMRVAGIVDRDAPTVKQYRELSNAYTEAANIVGIRPLEMQAITWTTYRREVDYWTHRKDN